MERRCLVVLAALLTILVLSLGFMHSVRSYAAASHSTVSAHTQASAAAAHRVSRSAHADTCAESIGLGVVAGLIENSIPGFAPTSPVDLGGFGNLTDCTP